ncbi:MAG TPA: single-stranded DNA-binding protein [Patescibacteria group bacterium]|jgi:single-strand DNA-binding protein|nr:single-stranded DNA-binding protein [Patescibacteria group bacterium]
MSKSINQVILLGNLTRDPELRAIPSGQNVCSFSLAVNRSWQGSDGQAQDAVDYFDVTAWGKLGELVNQYLKKGRKCLVMGRLSQRSWEQDGQKRSKVEVVANDVTFLDGHGDGDAGASRSSYSQSGSTPKARNDKKDDVVIEDIDDKPIDLSEIPF